MSNAPKPAMRQRIVAAGRFGLLLPIWPLVTATLLVDMTIGHRPLSQDFRLHPDEDYNATDHLIRRVTIREAEMLENPSDPRRDRPARPFGYLAEAWSLFLTRQQVGAELWLFERPQSKTQSYDDRYSRGYCWVRAGKVIAELAVEGVPGVRLIKTPRITDELRG